MSWTPEALERLDHEVIIRDHPTMTLDSGQVIYLCAGCGRLRPVIFLTGDRFLCTPCKTTGNERPTFVPA